jgi:hypothetical protein
MPNSTVSTKSAGLIVLQVIAGLVVVYIIYLLLIWVLKMDKVHIDKLYTANKQEDVDIFTGFIDASSKKISFNTTIPFADNYVSIRPSINIKGGSQFTYSFWINIGAGTDDLNVANKVLLLKGSDVPYDYVVTNTKKGSVTTVDNDRLVYCPMIKFGKDRKTFEVHFNTLMYHDEALIIESRPSEDSLLRNNLLSMIEGTWVLLSVSFEDNVPINEFENGIVVKFYVNDAIYKTGRYSSALKQNYGDLYVLPNDSPIAGVKIADMKYYNYAVSLAQLSDVVRQGPNTATSRLYLPSVSSTQGGLPTLSHYNSADILN